MVARLAKNLNADRRRAPPVGAIHENLNELWAPDARNLRIAPSGIEDSHDNELDRLYAALQAVTPEANPRTARLLASSTRKVAQKVIEEAGEVALATVKHSNRGIVRESADLLYHLAVLWRRAGIDPADVWGEMRRRADSLGIAEKLPKSKA
jgi:phosphoribosyl-ATP pyrophosphohydrolase